MSKSWIAAFAIISVGFVAAVEAELPRVEMLITPDRMSRSADRVASAVTTVTAEQIARLQLSSVSEVLRTITGVDVVQSGGAGGNTAVFIRGANSEHTLVLIDGIEANNPGATNRAFNFANLTVDQIERIEILRGPQSTLYGSDAMGGVIQIFTKRAARGGSAELSFEGGRYDTYVERAQVGYGSGSVSVNVGASRRDTVGFSAAEHHDGNQESDGSRNSSFAGKIDIKPHDNMRAALTLRGSNSDTRIDDMGGQGGDDPNRRLHNEEFFARSEGELSLLEGRWKPLVAFSYARHDLTDNDDDDPLHAIDLLRSSFEGERFELSVQNTIRITETVGVLAGVESDEEKAGSSYRSLSEFGPYDTIFDDQSVRSNGYFAQAIFDGGERLSTTIGARIDDHESFGSITTWRIAPVVVFPESGTKIMGTAGSGYKAPSLVQLYSSFGNRDLKAEESIGYDIGIEQKAWEGRITFEGRYFENDFDNLITFNSSTLILENISEARTRGVEAALRAEFSSSLSGGLQWTYTDSEDLDLGASLLRRARNKLAADLTYLYGQGSSITLSGLAIGARADNDFSSYPASRTTLAGYFLLNLASTVALGDKLEMTLRFENLLNAHYQDVLGYGTAGFGAYAGIRLKI